MVQDLVKQKGFPPYEYISGFKKFKERMPNKEKFHCSLTDKKVSDKEYGHVLTLFRIGLLGTAPGWRQKALPSVKYVTHILQ